VRTLSAVEAELFLVLGGVLRTRIGVRVGDSRRLAEPTDQNGVVLAHEGGCEETSKGIAMI